MEAFEGTEQALEALDRNAWVAQGASKVWVTPVDLAQLYLKRWIESLVVLSKHLALKQISNTYAVILSETLKRIAKQVVAGSYKGGVSSER